MIYGYGLEYAQEYLDSNVKLPKIAQDEVKKLLLKELVEDVCSKFSDAKCSFDMKAEMVRLSQRMSKLQKFKMFWKIRYSYKINYIQEILMYRFCLNIIEE